MGIANRKTNEAMEMHWLNHIVVGILVFISFSAKAEILPDELLKNPNTQATYLFYLHGEEVDEREMGYEESYDAVIDSLSDLGFTVASEIRPKNTIRNFPADYIKYAKHLGKRIKKLIDRGVSPKNIIIAGYSRGGILAMITSRAVAKRNISYVVMAGCPTAESQYKKDIPEIKSQFAPKLRGRFLSMIDIGDKEFSSCESYFDKSPRLFEVQEITINTRQGHHAFFEPRREWLEPLRSWAGLN